MWTSEDATYAARLLHTSRLCPPRLTPKDEIDELVTFKNNWDYVSFILNVQYNYAISELKFNDSLESHGKDIIITMQS